MCSREQYQLIDMCNDGLVSPKAPAIVLLFIPRFTTFVKICFWRFLNTFVVK